MRAWLNAHGIYLPERLVTAYEAQFGAVVFRWVHLRGGHWRRWWQPDRFSVSLWNVKGGGKLWEWSPPWPRARPGAQRFR